MIRRLHYLSGSLKVRLALAGLVLIAASVAFTVVLVLQAMEQRSQRAVLDADTQIDAGLMLHHVTSTGAENGSVRLGCEIVGMNPTAQRALQVYIDQTQKRRRMMSHE